MYSRKSGFSWDEPTKAVSFPIYQTATFGHIGLGHSTGFDYTREKNPTRQHLEEILTALEGAYDTTAFSSGMAAVTAVFDLFAPGDHVICSEDLYGGVTRLVNTIGKKNGLMVDFVNTGDLDEIKRVLRPETKALYIETPSNPMMEITDLSACAELAKEHNLLMITDNTFYLHICRTRLRSVQILSFTARASSCADITTRSPVLSALQRKSSQQKSA